jgi:hypothetical protein
LKKEFKCDTLDELKTEVEKFTKHYAGAIKAVVFRVAANSKPHAVPRIAAWPWSDSLPPPTKKSYTSGLHTYKVKPTFATTTSKPL